MEAQRLGYGGFNQVAAITGMHPETIRRGRDELADGLAGRPTGRVRLPGGGGLAGRGRASRQKKDPTLLADLIRLVEPETAGSPVAAERWVRASLRGLSKALNRRACPATTGRLHRADGYGLRGHAEHTYRLRGGEIRR